MLLAILALALAAYAAVAIHLRTRAAARIEAAADAAQWKYAELEQYVAETGMPLPGAIVRLDVFDANVKRMARLARDQGKTIRVATKSVRVPYLIERCLSLAPDVFAGAMCYTVPEAVFLAKTCGVTDVLVAYPTVQPSDLEAAWQVLLSGAAKLVLMVDCEAHVEALEALCRVKGRPGAKFSVCLDIDVACRPLGGASLLHLGARRSPLHGPDAVRRLVGRIQQSPNVRIVGAMAYDAHVAGVQDALPFTWLLNPVLRAARRLFAYDVRRQRRAAAMQLAAAGVQLEFFNGGGTGSAELAVADATLSEITVGSGLLQSSLFDHFHTGQLSQPAMLVGLQVTRRPSSSFVTCHSGGFIASGSPSPAAAPHVFLPRGLAPTSGEGWGEVQTPLSGAAVASLAPGSAVFVRTAKAGEIAERFRTYQIATRVVDGATARLEPVAVVPTYRGLNECFL